MRKLPELHEERETKYRELQTIDHANGGDEARSRFDTLEREVRELDNTIGRAQRAAELELRAPATPIGNHMRDLAQGIEEFQTAAFIAHISGVTGGPDVGRELEIVQHFGQRSGNGEGYSVPLAAFLPKREKRAMLYGGGAGSGAGLVFEQEIGDAIPALRPATIVGGNGATIIDGLTGGPVSISKVTTGKTAAFIAEDAAGTPSDPATDKVQMQPRHAIALTSLSRNLLLQSSASAQAMVNADIAAAVFGAIDRVALVGGGANEPSGIWDSVSPTSLAEPTWAEILAIIEATEIANAAGARAAWAMHPSAVRKLRSTTKVAFGSPTTLDASAGFLMDGPRDCAGYPVAVSTFVPTVGSPVSAAGIIYGDFSQLVIGVWESVQLLSNPYSEAEFRRGNVALRATASVDVALRYEEAFQTRTISV